MPPSAVVQQLWDLQQLDLELDRLRHEVRAAQARLGEPEAVRAAREAFEVADRAAHEAEADLRDRDLALGSLRERQAADQTKLYDGSVKGSRDLVDLHQLVEQQKRRIAQLEEAEIGAMAEVERLQAAREAARAAHQAATAAAETEQTRLTTQLEAWKTQGRAARRKRETALTGIDPLSLALYDKLVQQKRGRAVAIVDGSTCQGCRVNIPMPVVTRARLSSTPIACPSCGRLLLVK